MHGYMEYVEAEAVVAELGRISGESGDQAGVELCQRAKSLIEKQTKRLRLLEAMASASTEAIKVLADGFLVAAAKGGDLRLKDVEREAIRHLVSMATRSHYHCDDNWYSCPLAPDGCADDQQTPGVCNCGAAEHNAKVTEESAILSRLIERQLECSNAEAVVLSTAWQTAEARRGLFPIASEG